jgi:hypothetical protein
MLALPPRKGRSSLGIGNKRAVSVVDNLGLGGLFIRTPDPPPAGTFIQLLIDAPTGEVRARATVQRSSPKQGMGRNSSRWNTNIARDSRDGLKLCPPDAVDPLGNEAAARTTREFQRVGHNVYKRFRLRTRQGDVDQCCDRSDQRPM